MLKAAIVLVLLSAGCLVLPFAVKGLGYHELARDLFPFMAMACLFMANSGVFTGAWLMKRRSSASPHV
jgi:hypothetical protein